LILVAFRERLLDLNGKKPKRPVRIVFCNILEYEIPLSRCKPVREYKKCKVCEGYLLKQKPKKKSKERRNENGA
jgi:hypothetical protein